MDDGILKTVHRYFWVEIRIVLAQLSHGNHLRYLGGDLCRDQKLKNVIIMVFGLLGFRNFLVDYFPKLRKLLLELQLSPFYAGIRSDLELIPVQKMLLLDSLGGIALYNLSISYNANPVS